MIVVVKLFAGARELTGQEEIEVVLSDNATVKMLREAIQKQSPELSPLLPHAMFAIDASYANDEMRIPADAEIACIPPVSGG